MKDFVPATLPDCDLNHVVPVGVPLDPVPDSPLCASVSCPRVLSVSPALPSVIPVLAKSWNETGEVNREELAEDLTFERLLNDLPGVSHCLMIPVTSTFNLECRE